MKFDMCSKNIKNIQFNIQIFKIYNTINLFSKGCSLRLQLCMYPNFSLNFDLLNNILGPYKQIVSLKKGPYKKKRKNPRKFLPK